MLPSAVSIGFIQVLAFLRDNVEMFFELSLNILDTFLAVYLLSAILGAKSTKHKIWCNAVFFAVMTGANFLIKDISLSMFATLGVWLVLSSIFFKGKFHAKIFYHIILAVFFVLSETLASLLLLAFSGAGLQQMHEFGISRIIGTIMSKIVFFILVRIAIEIREGKKSKIPFKYWIVLMTVPLLCVFTAILLYQIKWDLIVEAVNLPLLWVVSFGLLIIGVMVFFLFENFADASSLAKDNRLMEQHIEMQNSHFLESELAYRETRRLWHDMNNHLLCLKQMKEDGNLSHVDTYIEELSSSLEQGVMPCRSGVPVIDTVVSVKYRHAVSEDIDFIINVAGIDCSSFSQMDLCTVISNVVDNAIEECESFEGEKTIELSISENENYLILNCANSISEKTKSKSNLLETRKRDPENHGIGLKSVRSTINKYNGNMVAGIENDKFCVHIIMMKSESRDTVPAV
ncbi:MAG: GHKL domain-containing protein [Oscillospiraceae bacterium]|jgi:sensor histidine kinase YesM|nr:GHKL domain-containing protein [Oscillospiraceae bacterium]